MAMTPTKVDHLPLTDESVEANCGWYHNVLPADIEKFRPGRKAASGDNGKIYIHAAENLLLPVPWFRWRLPGLVFF